MGKKLITPSWFPVLAIVFATLLVIPGYIPVLNWLLIPILVFLLLFYRYLLGRNTQSSMIPAWILVVIVGLFLGIYRPDSFHYPLLFGAEALYEGGKPFNLHVNTSKLLAGYLILFLLLPVIRIPGKVHITSPAATVLTVFALALTILFAAFFILDLELHSKPVHYVALFGLVNPLVTCVSEEAFMRLIFQSQLVLFISKYTERDIIRKGVPLAVATLLFVAVHSISSMELLVVYALAGAIYGLAYTLTNNIFASIGTHFLVNIIHFSFLTYPV